MCWKAEIGVGVVRVKPRAKGRVRVMVVFTAMVKRCQTPSMTQNGQEPGNNYRVYYPVPRILAAFLASMIASTSVR